jgi:putative ABC transport system permease protein
MVLAGVGIFGLMHYTVTRRTQEIGIRGALGAKPCDLLRLILGQGMRLAFWGIAIGICTGFVLTRLIGSLLFGIGPTDAVTFVTAPILLALTSLLASYIPAWRAMRMDPIVALRYE